MSDICGACWHTKPMHPDKCIARLPLGTRCPCRKYVEE